MENLFLKKYLKYKNKYLNIKQKNNTNEYIGGNDASYNPTTITNKQIALRALHNGYADQIPIYLIDYDVAYAMTEKHNISALKYFDYHKLPYIDNFDIVLLAVQIDGHALAFASPRLQDNDNIVLAAITQDYDALKYASDRLKDTPDMVLACVRSSAIQRHHSKILQYASERLQNNRVFVLTIVQINPFELYAALPEFKDDYEIVLAAVSKDNNALRYASSRFKNNSDLILAQANAIR
jgi:hypothetical protein